jgi:hypothetical protein
MSWTCIREEGPELIGSEAVEEIGEAGEMF